MEEEIEDVDRECICSHPKSSHDDRGCGQFINENLGDCECPEFRAL